MLTTDTWQLLSIVVLAPCIAAIIRYSRTRTESDWRRLLENDKSVRVVGAVGVVFGTLVAFPFGVCPYIDAIRGVPRISYYPGGIGLSIMFIVVGAIYLVAGSAARRFMPFGDIHNAKLIHWIVIAVVAAIAFQCESAFEHRFKELGYQILPF
jgi:hypothetical protein